MTARKLSKTPPPSVSTAEVLALAVSGDGSALNDLLRRYLPILKRSAHGRLPATARDRGDTDDLVQDALVGFLRRLEHFKALRPGALLAFIRLSIMNRVRDEARRVARRPLLVDREIGEIPSSLRSPFEELQLSETAARFEQALATLREPDRRAIVGVELGYTYSDLAGILGKPTVNAARVATLRAFDKLMTTMQPGVPASRRRAKPQPRHH